MSNAATAAIAGHFGAVSIKPSNADESVQRAEFVERAGRGDRPVGRSGGAASGRRERGVAPSRGPTAFVETTGGRDPRARAAVPPALSAARGSRAYRPSTRCPHRGVGERPVLASPGRCGESGPMALWMVCWTVPTETAFRVIQEAVCVDGVEELSDCCRRRISFRQARSTRMSSYLP